MRREERIAICRAVTQLVLADGLVKDPEWELLDRLAARLELEPDERKRAQQVDFGGDARAALQALAPEARAAALDELAAAALVDGELGKAERRLLVEVAESFGQGAEAVEAALQKARGS